MRRAQSLVVVIALGMASCTSESDPKSVAASVPELTCDSFASHQYDWFQDHGYLTPQAALEASDPKADAEDYRVVERTSRRVLLVRNDGDEVVAVATADRSRDGDGWLVPMIEVCQGYG